MSAQQYNDSRCENDIEKAKVVHVKTYDYPDMIKRVEDVINEQIQTFLNSITSNHVKNVNIPRRSPANLELGYCLGVRR
ncbi:hypothetical protein ANCCEY_04962 [Ancylostoma ceylanicum]|uniref:Uncharacterized protein n=1 Tax=Ancylostoma ceylanicum TaxID=53326 RepID=A0A0D6LVT9_9BILA|nr:hypothetical protein ANCCEY_04962 [Ancylostoma ceylanicum]